MTIEKLAFQHDASANLYVAAFNAAGEVFDYDTDTWVALALPPVNPFLSVTERAGTGGNGFSDYWADVDYSLLNPTSTEAAIRLKVYERVGGSNSLSADTVVGIADVVIVSSTEADGGNFTECVLSPIYRAGADTIYFTAQLRVNGQPVTLDPADECTIVVRQINPLSGLNLFSIGPVTPDANGLFTLSQVNPNLNSDTSIYRALIEMVVGGVSYAFESHFPSYA